MSAVKCLFDENLNPRFKATLVRRRPEIDVLQVGDAGAPPRGILDPQLLVYLEHTHRILITNNRESMPDHLRDHWSGGGICWGVFSVRRGTTYVRLAEERELLWGATEAEEWLNATIWVPSFS